MTTRLFATILAIAVLLGAAPANVARATPASPPPSTGVLFLTITNHGSEADQLIRATSPIATTLDVHETTMDGSRMHMAPLDHPLTIAGGDSVELRPQGLHIMLMDIRESLTAGMEFPVTLTFVGAGSVDLTVPVLATEPADGEGTGGPFTVGDLEISHVWSREAPKLGAEPSDASCATPEPEAVSCSVPLPSSTPGATSPATPAPISSSAAYLRITNQEDSDDRLIAVRTDIADHTMIHNMTIDGTQMTMTAVEGGVVIPAGETVAFEPQGLHIMLMGLQRSMLPGDSIALTLSFEQAGDVVVTVPVAADEPEGGEPTSVGGITIEGVWARMAPMLTPGSATPSPAG